MDSKFIIGGVGNWAHDSFKVSLSNLPYHYEIYV